MCLRLTEIMCYASSMTSAQDAHDELQEFQQMSRDYETELETELKQCEARNKELHSHNERLRSELENIKVGHCTVWGCNISLQVTSLRRAKSFGNQDVATLHIPIFAFRKNLRLCTLMPFGKCRG